MFEEGKNIESGTHEELLARPNGKYRKFYFASLGHDEESDGDGETASECGSEASAKDSEETAVSEPDSSDELADVNLEWQDRENSAALESDKDRKARDRSDSGFHLHP